MDIPEEHVVLVDDHNQVLGIAPKASVHTHETPLHRAFSVFLFNFNKEVLLQRRSLHKKTWPGVWSNTCCGHPALGETTQNAAVRRLKFELNLSAPELLIMLPDFRYRVEKDHIVENEICPVLVGKCKDLVKPNPDEVSDIKYKNWFELGTELEKNPDVYSPWLFLEYKALNRDQTFLDWFNA